MVTLRAMTRVELPLVAGWLREDHVARWWLEGSSYEQELDECRRSVLGEEPTDEPMAIYRLSSVG